MKLRLPRTKKQIALTSVAALIVLATPVSIYAYTSQQDTQKPEVATVVTEPKKEESEKVEETQLVVEEAAPVEVAPTPAPAPVAATPVALAPAPETAPATQENTVPDNICDMVAKKIEVLKQSGITNREAIFDNLKQGGGLYQFYTQCVAAGKIQAL